MQIFRMSGTHFRHQIKSIQSFLHSSPGIFTETLYLYLARYHELGDSIKASEKRLAEIAVLKAHIINYAKTRPVYDAYRKNGYSKRFLETHRTEITLHKAAKAAFDESNLKKLPKVKELDAEYSKLLTEKKARYPDYRKAACRKRCIRPCPKACASQWAMRCC